MQLPKGSETQNSKLKRFVRFVARGIATAPKMIVKGVSMMADNSIEANRNNKIQLIAVMDSYIAALNKTKISSHSSVPAEREPSATGATSATTEPVLGQTNTNILPPE